MFRRNTDGSVAVQKKEAFCVLVQERPFGLNDSLKTVLNSWCEYILTLEPGITRESLSNCRGDWYEWILAIAAWNQRVSQNSNRLALLLPNVGTFDANTLYHGEVFDLIDDLKQKVRLVAGVSFVTSNPDFVILQSDNFDELLTQTINFETIDVQTLNAIEEAYEQFIGHLEFNDLIGYASVKTSFRPDRRLQIAHEGSLVKAIHQHIITRKWIMNPRPLRYYAISASVGQPDRLALKTIATHSIIAVNQVPISAVDEVFQIDSYSAAFELFGQLYAI